MINLHSKITCIFALVLMFTIPVSARKSEVAASLVYDQGLWYGAEANAYIGDKVTLSASLHGLGRNDSDFIWDNPWRIRAGFNPFSEQTEMPGFSTYFGIGYWRMPFTAVNERGSASEVTGSFEGYELFGTVDYREMSKIHVGFGAAISLSQKGEMKLPGFSTLDLYSFGHEDAIPSVTWFVRVGWNFDG